MSSQPVKHPLDCVLRHSSLCEQFIGVIVSCMPVLPAFYRHIRTQGSSRDAGSSGGLSASILGFQKRSKSSSDRSKSSGGRSGGRARDPFPISEGTLTTRGLEEGYHELDEVDKSLQHDRSMADTETNGLPDRKGTVETKEQWPLPS